MLFGVHIVPPFDTWWPNEYAAFWWGLPTAAVALWRSIRAHKSRKALHAKVDRLHARLGFDDKRGDTP